MYVSNQFLKVMLIENTAPAKGKSKDKGKALPLKTKYKGKGKAQTVPTSVPAVPIPESVVSTPESEISQTQISTCGRKRSLTVTLNTTSRKRK